LANYILEAIKKNVQTSSSIAKEVIVRVDLLQPTHFIVDGW
jgi:hypothetical protein